MLPPLAPPPPPLHLGCCPARLLRRIAAPPPHLTCMSVPDPAASFPCPPLTGSAPRRPPRRLGRRCSPAPPLRSALAPWTLCTSTRQRQSAKRLRSTSRQQQQRQRSARRAARPPTARRSPRAAASPAPRSGTAATTPLGTSRHWAPAGWTTGRCSRQVRAGGQGGSGSWLRAWAACAAAWPGTAGGLGLACGRCHAARPTPILPPLPLCSAAAADCGGPGTCAAAPAPAAGD